MRILHIIQKQQLRGAEIFASQLSKHLIASGHEVIMVAIFQEQAILPFDGKIINLNRSSGKRFFDFGGWGLLAKIIGDYKPDVVQANAGDTLKFCSGEKPYWINKLISIIRQVARIREEVKLLSPK